MAKKEPLFDYAAKTAELDTIIAALQDPEIQIDAATAMHSKGLAIIAEIETYLQQAEIEVTKRTTA